MTFNEWKQPWNTPQPLWFLNMPVKNNKQTIEKYNWRKVEEAKSEEF
jgi:hypothetical protein